MKVFFKTALDPSAILESLRAKWPTWKWSDAQAPDLSGSGNLGARPLRLQVIRVLLPPDPLKVGEPASSPYYVLRLNKSVDPSQTADQARAEMVEDDTWIQEFLAIIQGARVGEEELRNWINRTPGK